MARPKKGEEHPRPQVAEDIRVMLAIGMPQERVAGILRMSLETLHTHYKDELEYGKETLNALVGGKIIEAVKRGEQWACTLWAARRMGWKETTATELAGKDGAPLVFQWQKD